jgi:hypothetical protein
MSFHIQIRREGCDSSQISAVDQRLALFVTQVKPFGPDSRMQ